MTSYVAPRPAVGTLAHIECPRGFALPVIVINEPTVPAHLVALRTLDGHLIAREPGALYYFPVGPTRATLEAAAGLISADHGDLWAVRALVRAAAARCAA